MRMLLLAAVVAVMVAEGCGLGAEKERQRVRDQEFSAARLNGQFKADDPLVKMLSPSEREAMVRAGMMEESELSDSYLADDEDGEEEGEGEDEKTTSEKAGDAVMSFLVVGVTLGMMAAPYLLF